MGSGITSPPTYLESINHSQGVDGTVGPSRAGHAKWANRTAAVGDLKLRLKSPDFSKTKNPALNKSRFSACLLSNVYCLLILVSRVDLFELNFIMKCPNVAG